MNLNLFKFVLLFLFLVFSSCRKEPDGGSQMPEEAVFEWLSPEKTGVDFIQTITEEYRYNFSLDANIFNGGGVAVLDVDNDGLQDLFFTSRLQPCRLYRNLGNLTFEDISEAAGLSDFIGVKTGVTVVDINADGWQDVYVCRTFLTPIPERRNLLFVNNGDNTFSEMAARYGLDDLSPSQHALFFDYDRDGDLDCYVLNHPVTYNLINTIDFTPSPERPFAAMQPPRDSFESDKLFRNEGGTFTDVSREAGIYNRAWGLSVMSSDFNEDGWPDLYVANDFIMPDFLYINNRDGTFTDKSQEYLHHMTNHTMGIEIADLNNDARPEIVALDMLGETWERRHRQLSTMQLERYRQLIRQGYGDQQMRNTLQLNNGNGHYSETGCLAGMFDTEWSWAPLAADFDADGFKDLFISNGVRRDLNDIDFFVYTADSINRTGGISPERFQTFEDFSSLMPSEKIPNRMFRNTGSLQLRDVTKQWGLAQPTFSNGAAYADLDNDGDLDLIVHNIDDPPFIYRNKTAESKEKHWLQIKCKGPALNPVGTGVRLYAYQADRLISFQEINPVRGFYSSVEPIVEIGLGSEIQLDRLEIVWPDGSCQTIEDVPADQRLEVQYTNSKPCSDQKRVAPEPIFVRKEGWVPFEHRENEFEDFNRERLLPHRFSRQGPPMAMADVNGDGLDDLFVGGAAGQAGVLLIATVDGSFAPVSQPDLVADAAFEDTGARFFDANGDGRPDLYVVSGGNEWPANDPMYQDRLYLNHGQGVLVKSDGLPQMFHSGKAVAAFDYDDDGDLDLFIGGRVVPGRFPVAPQSMVLENDGGHFRDVTTKVAPDFGRAGMVTAIELADLDGDGQAELILAGEWMPIQIFRQVKGIFSPVSALPSGWWNCLETVDMDGDGDLDLVAGNLGLNSRYEVQSGAPMKLYEADFDANGSVDPVLCIAENGKYIPVPMRDQLFRQLPHLKKKFVRNAAYARASISEVFSEKELKEARLLETEILASAWFENQGNTWVTHPLPDEAQIAPVYGILPGDFTRDGIVDLLLVGNDSGFDPETGPLDTSPGCMLRGTNGGVFRVVPPVESGFWATKEARSILGSATTGVVIIGNNDGPVQVFRIREADSR